MCCVLGVEYYSEAPEPQTNKRKRILNVQSSVLSKFGVEDSAGKEADFTRYSTGSTKSYRYRFLLCMYTFALIF